MQYVKSPPYSNTGNLHPQRTRAATFALRACMPSTSSSILTEQADQGDYHKGLVCHACMYVRTRVTPSKEAQLGAGTARVALSLSLALLAQLISSGANESTSRLFPPPRSPSSPPSPPSLPPLHRENGENCSRRLAPAQRYIQRQTRKSSRSRRLSRLAPLYACVHTNSPLHRTELPA